jgi:hypothetical protein
MSCIVSRYMRRSVTSFAVCVATFYEDIAERRANNPVSIYSGGIHKRVVRA